MASTARPPSIGERGTSGFLRVRDQAPLPQTRDKVIAEVNRILGLGLVQKLVIEVGQPITYERLVKKDEAAPDLEAVETADVYGAARNAPMEDCAGTGDPFKLLFFACSQLQAQDAVPVAILFKSYSVVRAWFGLPDTFPLPTICGIATYQHLDIPDDVLLLVGGDKLDPDTIKISIRIPIDLPKKGKKP